MTKQEKIQEAYGEYWELFNNTAKQCALDNNGWINPYLEHAPNQLDLERNGSSGFYRPKSLQGIENNNGWIKIENESDIPKEDCNCHVEFLDGSISIDMFFVNYKNFNAAHWNNIAAYQVISEPSKRVY